MKFEEIVGMTVEELNKKRNALDSELFELKMKGQFGQLSNPLSIRLTRRDLARIKTALNMKLAN